MRLALVVLGLLLAVPALAQPRTFASGLTVALPADWSGPEQVVENELPRAASYRFENANAGSPLRGAVLHVELRTGLNPMMRERFTQGRVPFGYHGARPTAALAPAQVPFPAAVGFLAEREGHISAVYFVARGTACWTVQIEAPRAVFEVQRSALVALAGALRFGAGA